ncbi:hypothetical protein Tco_0481110 [Tanacetum coccineum]
MGRFGIAKVAMASSGVGGVIVSDVLAELAIAKCLNSTEYLSSLGAAIGKAVEKGMQEGLSAGITHGAAGRILTDVAAYNPSEEADYLSALQRLQSLMVPIYHSPDQTAIGATSLSFSLDVSVLGTDPKDSRKILLTIDQLCVIFCPLSRAFILLPGSTVGTSGTAP